MRINVSSIPDPKTASAAFIPIIFPSIDIKSIPPKFQVLPITPNNAINNVNPITNPNRIKSSPKNLKTNLKSHSRILSIEFNPLFIVPSYRLTSALIFLTKPSKSFLDTVQLFLYTSFNIARLTGSPHLKFLCSCFCLRYSHPKNEVGDKANTGKEQQY